ncbi:MAG: carboxylesterase family protein [Tetrasphaera sp.]
MNPRTRVSGGDLQGAWSGDVAVFRGVPFASLPARFAAPAPPAPWTGHRVATTFGPPPPQSGGPGSTAGTADGDDWLTVNVWSPDVAGRLPVMVWIQGGGYMFGTSGLPEYDGTRLARLGVVVVTFNYRVGLEGFGQIDQVPANRGLLDQVAALEWVQDNIAAFGGDPLRVTLFGQSAGAGSIASLLVMPRASGLFARAIAQSVPGAFFTPALAADITRACAAHVGRLPGELDQVAPGALAEAGGAVLATMDEHIDRWGLAAHAGVVFAPIVDGDVLPTTPWRGLSEGVGLLVGHTRNEQRLLSALTGRLGRVTAEQAQESARLFAPAPEAYTRRFTDPEELDDIARSDWLFRMPSVKLAEAHLTVGPTHVYELTWPAPGMGGVLGACHGLDVPLVFGNLAEGQTAMLIGEEMAAARAVSDRMQAAWTAFAATGDPGWPTFDGGRCCVFDTDSQIADYPEEFSRRHSTSAPDVLDLS